MDLYNNISNKELPAFLRAAYEESGKDIEKAADIVETTDMLLGVLKAKSLINSRERSAKTKWTRGRNIKAIFENIILRKRHGTDDL